MSDFQLDPTSAMTQAGMTAEDYLSKAHKILSYEYNDWTVSNAVELAKIMAQDFHTSMMCMKMQEIRDALHELAESKTS